MQVGLGFGVSVFASVGNSGSGGSCGVGILLEPEVIPP